MNLSATDNALLPETARFGYIPGLDGIRALAVLIVLIAHMGFEHILPGGFGVTVFFFISGFLITRLLLAESDKQGQIGLKNFYTRRIVRLYPALLFMVLGTTAIYGLSGIEWPSIAQFLAAVFYLMNGFHVYIAATGQDYVMPWTHLWSLAVEEHFYLIFPLLMVACRRNWRRAAYALIGVIIFAVAWRTYILMGTDLPVAAYNYMMTDTRLDSLAWGCLLSVMLHISKDHLKFKTLIGLLPCAIAVLGLLASFVIRDETFRYTIRYTLQGAALFILVLNFYYWQPVRFAVRWLEFRPLAWIGQISYALYLWHVPVIDITLRIMGMTPLAYVTALIVSLYMAAFSYYIVEVRFLALRKHFGSHGIGRPEKAPRMPKPKPDLYGTPHLGRSKPPAQS